MSRKLNCLIVCCIFLTLGFLGCKETRPQPKSLTKEIKFSDNGRLTVYKQDSKEAIATFKIETAIGDYETATGLMHRKSMPRDWGMLFLFDESQPRSFYMKNTIIELDIVYIDANQKIVKIYRNTSPFDPTSLPSVVPIKYALELNGVVTSNLDIEEGDYVEWSLK
jgi:uncharacterized membrane protein (UPF0127 family)